MSDPGLDAWWGTRLAEPAVCRDAVLIVPAEALVTV
jgi:hypothetical protein